MQYRSMPNSDERLSVLGFGCMRLPTRVGGQASSLIDKDAAVRQIAMAVGGRAVLNRGKKNGEPDS